jgi:ectoine hydroxylase-related dioxygenase (phytanoyl-CoA dioxygenase family)
LHADWGPRAPRGPFHFFNSLWLLDEFASDNGSTRVVPGTHRHARPIDKTLSSPASHHPDEQQVLAPAGSVLLFNGHLWHSGTCNTTGKPRRVIQCSYVAAENRHVAPVSIETDELLDDSIMCLL